MQRLKLLQILEKRAVELGVEIEHDVVIDSIEPYQDADLIVVENGITSFIREDRRKRLALMWFFGLINLSG